MNRMEITCLSIRLVIKEVSHNLLPETIRYPTQENDLHFWRTFYISEAKAFLKALESTQLLLRVYIYLGSP